MTRVSCLCHSFGGGREEREGVVELEEKLVGVMGRGGSLRRRGECSDGMSMVEERDLVEGGGIVRLWTLGRGERLGAVLSELLSELTRMEPRTRRAGSR